MASSIKKSSKAGETKTVKVKDKNDVEKVLSSNKSTIVTGTQSPEAAAICDRVLTLADGVLK